MYEVLIVGGGPAGLAATMYCLRKGIDVQMVTGRLGGKSTLSLNLPDMAEYHVLKSREQVQVFRGRIEYLSHIWRKGHVDAVKEEQDGFRVSVRSHTGGPEGRNVEELSAERLIVATGTKPRPLNVPGEREFFGRGLGSSALSYSHLLRDRRTVIIGDGDRAIEAALECALQAAHVTLVLEPHARYSHSHLDLVKTRDGIEILNGYRVLQFQGDDYARTVELCRGGADCMAGRPHKTIDADAFFVEREPVPNSAAFRHLVACTETGAIKIDATNTTSNERIFAAGDVTTVGVEQILVALGEGARAGLSAYRRLTLVG